MKELTRRQTLRLGAATVAGLALMRAALLPFAKLRELLRVHEVRVRVERLQHSTDRTVHELIGLDLLDVARFDDVERGGERLVLIGQAVFPRRDAAAEHTAEQSECEDRRDPQHEAAGTGHARDSNR